VSEQPTANPRDLQAFVLQLGAALNATGEPVYLVQERLNRVAGAYGARSSRVSAFPTFMMVTLGDGEPTTLEIVTSLAAPRLDQISALDRLVTEAERGLVEPRAGLRRLGEIDAMHPRFGVVQSIVGYAVLATGLCLILQSTARELLAAAVLGAVVGVLRSLGRRQPPLQVLMPILAAFCVSGLAALAVENDVSGPWLRGLVAALVVFLPGATLTTAVLELAAGQMVSGASRLVAGCVQLAFLAFGIIAGLNAVGVPSALVLSVGGKELGAWAPWLGVLVFACGVAVSNSAPTRSLPALLVVLYAAWGGQVLGNAVFGAYVSAFAGALVMTPVARWASRLPRAMPRQAAFMPGFWLLVPGSLGLIGLTQLAGDVSVAGAQELLNTVVAIFAVAIGVLCGSLILDWTASTTRIVGSFAATATDLAAGGRRPFSPLRRRWSDRNQLK
jgi:uncharacterized membrane protein YjjP (DUF1212 family)